MCRYVKCRADYVQFFEIQDNLARWHGFNGLGIKQ
jgi:hypothetical protein